MPATDATLTVPDVYANTQVILFGVAEKDNPLDSKKPMDISFRVRPEIDPIDLPKGASAADFGWESLDVMTSNIDKVGKVTREQLRARLLSKLEAAVQKMTDSALQIPQTLRDKMNQGPWAAFSKYQMLACVVPAFAEANAPGIDHVGPPWQAWRWEPRRWPFPVHDQGRRIRVG